MIDSEELRQMVKDIAKQVVKEGLPELSIFKFTIDPSYSGGNFKIKAGLEETVGDKSMKVCLPFGTADPLASAEGVGIELGGQRMVLGAIGDLVVGGRHVVLDAITNAVSRVLLLGHNSSGSVANNFGESIDFQLETTTTPDVDAGSIIAVWGTATHASRSSVFIFQTVTNAGAKAEHGRISHQGITATPHFLATGSTPTLTAGTGAGTGPTGVSITGNDTRGVINFTTGTAPAASATIYTVTFNVPFDDAAQAMINPNNALATTQIARFRPGNDGTTSFDIISVAALDAGAAYSIRYWVIG